MFNRYCVLTSTIMTVVATMRLHEYTDNSSNIIVMISTAVTFVAMAIMMMITVNVRALLELFAECCLAKHSCVMAEPSVSEQRV